MENEILTLQEVANYLKVDEKTIYRMLKSKQIPAFRIRNQWRFKKNEIENWMNSQSISDQNDKFEIPIIGKVAAGQPILAEQNKEGTLTVDKHVIKNPHNIFALKVKGDSMIKAGIFDGDYILVHQQSIAEPGEIIVALIDDEVTVKRFYKEKDKIRLQPENDAMTPITVDPSNENFMILGKVKCSIRKYS